MQQFMVEQRRTGRLLCLCSENELADVEEVFAVHTEMPLTMSDIVVTRVNWKAKSENIASLAEELGLGLDRFIFVDDNPIESRR